MHDNRRVSRRKVIAIVCVAVAALILFVPLPMGSASSSSACVYDAATSGECNDSIVVDVPFESLFQLLVRNISN
jgi:hypothetical protein